MASNNNTTTMNLAASAYSSDPNTQNTTFVQADPSNFRAVVQRLTGAPENSTSQKMPLNFPSRTTSKHPPQAASEMAPPRRAGFKLHERRQRKLEIQLNNHSNNLDQYGLVVSPSGQQSGFAWQRGGAGGGGFVMVSPVSTLDLFARGSPRTPCEEEEEKAIAEKGFYLHPSTPRGPEPPELLPLFPLHSPRDNNND